MNEKCDRKFAYHEYKLDNSTFAYYDEAEPCESTPTTPKRLRKQAKRLLKDAAKIEQERKATRKAQKAAKEEQAKREAEHAQAVAVVRGIATGPHVRGDQLRLDAALALIDRGL